MILKLLRAQAKALLPAILVLCLVGGMGALRTPAAGAAENEPAQGDEPVIPPGQEELLADMLGRGATLPGQCSFANGGVERTTVKAAYTCPGGEVVFELHHPSKAPAGATQTARFAVTVRAGSPPAGMAEAL